MIFPTMLSIYPGQLMILYKLIGLPLTGFFLALVGSSGIVMVLNWKIMVMVASCILWWILKSNEAELLAIRKALDVTSSKDGFSGINLMLESDSQIVIGWMKNESKRKLTSPLSSFRRSRMLTFREKETECLIN
jgi:ribonuclease HI